MRKRKVMLLAFPIIILCVAAGYVLYIYNYSKQWENRMYPKVIIKNIDFSGKNKDTVLSQIRDSTKASINRKFTIKALNKTYVFEFKSLNPKYNIDQVVDKAFLYGKDLSFFDKYNILKKPQEKKYDLTLSYEKKPIMSFVEKLSQDIDKQAHNASLRLNSCGRFIVNDEVNGRNIDKEFLEKQILYNIDNNLDGEIYAKIDDIKPRITAASLSKVDSLISTFSTNYSKSNEQRSKNISIATRAINGTLIMPGDMFSFNKVVGERSRTRGFEQAPTVVNNKLEKSYGGGVCQVSTTLYNAAIRANLKSYERTNHSLLPAYIGPGLDATVSSCIDYKFKNMLRYPVYIEAYAGNGRVTFNIYSSSSLKGIKYNLVNNVYKEITPKTMYVNDPKLTIGKKEEVQTSYTGCKVRVYLIGTKNGREISRQLISNDTYNAVNSVIRRGTRE